jgi:hypothetical protein
MNVYMSYVTCRQQISRNLCKYLPTYIASNHRRQESSHFITEVGILHSHRRENLKSYIALTACALYRRRIMFPVRFELGSYIPEDSILYSHRRQNPKSYIFFPSSEGYRRLNLITRSTSSYLVFAIFMRAFFNTFRTVPGINTGEPIPKFCTA